MNRYDGGCHCGAITLSLATASDIAGLLPRYCGCDFCRKHGCVYVATADGRLEIIVHRSGTVSRYAFGHRTADFLVCRTCGVMPAALSEIGGKLHGIVNSNAFDPALSIDRAALSTGDYDGETAAARLDRRAQRWVSDVVIHGLG